MHLPEGLTTRQAMAIGTAGFTAMLAVIALERHELAPGSEVLVTGAAGGVGGVAIALLSRLGHKPVASTGRAELNGYLEALGAAEIHRPRGVLGFAPARPLDRERWDGAIDAVGGTTLATILTQLKYRASVAACGLAGGSDLPATVIPFLLRGVNLLGIDSVMCPKEPRREAWQRLAKDLPLDRLEGMIEEIPLSQIAGLAPRILGGQIRGRTVVDAHRPSHRPFTWVISHGWRAVCSGRSRLVFAGRRFRLAGNCPNL